MIDVNKPPEVQKATILMIITGAFNTYSGFAFFQNYVFFPVLGTIMIVFGFLTFCASLIVWLQYSWATKLLAIFGVVFCVALVIFAAWLMGFILAAIYWVAINWIRTSPPIEIPDWAEE